MKTVFVVMESTPRDNTRVSKVFANKVDALAYRDMCRGDDEFYSFDSAYQYWVDEWELC